MAHQPAPMTQSGHEWPVLLRCTALTCGIDSLSIGSLISVPVFDLNQCTVLVSWALSSKLNRGGWRPEGRSSPMTVRSDNKDHSLTDNLWVELSLLAVVTVILIVLAWGYVW
jgi:hypothetical protein